MRFYPMSAYGPGIKRVSAACVLGATGAVPAKGAKVAGVPQWRGAYDAFTLTRTAAGQYTITWDDKAFKGSFVSATVEARVGVPGGNPTITQDIRMGVPSLATGAANRFVKFSTTTSGSVADLATDSELHFEFTFKFPNTR